MTEKLTDEDKAGLSPEEIAALEENDEATPAATGATDDDPTFGADVDPETGKTKAQASDDTQSTVDGDVKTDDADAGGKEGGADETGKAATGDDDDIDSGNAPLIPQLHAEPVVDFDKKMGALNDELNALAKKFGDGDISFEELQIEQTRVHDARADLRAQMRESEMVDRINQSSEEGLWKREQDDFFEDHAEYRKNPILMGALNTAVVSLANAPENANRTGTWILNKAHKEVAKIMTPQVAPGVKVPEGGEKPGGKQDAGKQPTRKADLKSVPRTLAGAPAADLDTPGKGEFDDLDNLTGLDYENALARLTPEQQAKYLRSA